MIHDNRVVIYYIVIRLTSYFRSLIIDVFLSSIMMMSIETKCEGETNLTVMDGMGCWYGHWTAVSECVLGVCKRGVSMVRIWVMNSKIDGRNHFEHIPGYL